MRILHIASINFQLLQAGLTYSVPKLVQHQASLEGCSTALLNIRSSDSCPDWLRVPVIPFRGFAGNTFADVPDLFQKPDLAVFHSTYIPAYAAIGRHLRRRGIPYVITPRGGMTRFAQSLSRTKKFFGNLLFFDRLVKGSEAIHCLTQGEADEIVRWESKRFVVGNGIDIPAATDLATPGSRDQLVLTYIGRTDFHNKGLDLLVSGVARITGELRRNGAVINIHGPDNKRGGYRQLRRAIAETHTEDLIHLHPGVWGRDKVAVLQASDVFVLLSRSEGHPMGLLEALAHGVPALVTPGTRMAEEIEAAGAGWKVAESADGVAERLIDVLNERDKLHKMGQYARGLISARYTWDRIATETVRHYRKVLHERTATAVEFAK